MRRAAEGLRVHLGLAGAVAALTVAVLGACTGDAADPTTSTPTSSASSSSASPTSPATSASPSPTSAYVPVKPKFPAAAKKQTDAGAVAFVEYYWAALNYAWTRPDPNILRGLSVEDCISCKSLKNAAHEYAILGQRFNRPPVDLKSSRLVFNALGHAQVETLLVRTSASLIDASGGRLKTNNEASVIRMVRIEWLKKWQIVHVVDG